VARRASAWRRLRTRTRSGTFCDLYLLVEAGDELLVVDGHAAHERVNYEWLARAFDGEAVPTADLDPPVAVSLSADEAAAAEAHADALAALGFETEPFGGGPSGSGPSRRRSGTRSTRPRSAMRSRPSQAGRRRGTPAKRCSPIWRVTRR